VEVVGWELPRFDDSHWSEPTLIGGYLPGWNPSAMDHRTGNIWATSNAQKSYCRARKMAECDVEINRKAAYFTKVDPGEIRMGLVETETEV